VFHLVLSRNTADKIIKKRQSAERKPKMKDSLDAYVADLLKDKGQPDSEEMHQALLVKVNDSIDQALIEALPLKQLDELEQATSEGRTDESLLEKLLNEVGADTDKIISETLKNFRNNYLKGAK